MADFHLKKGDRLPALKVQFLDADGLPINLTGKTVRFSMRLVGSSTPKINNAPATVDNATSGMASYAWQATDVDTPGMYQGEFDVVEADGKVQTVPANGYISIEIEDTLA